ncbi:hypothetical protein DRP04_01850 [Archaeoglobales archaeon]|nr:MAG: hypothetical protein DRP04_01850 [Archaeoglobales archaeon]
MLNLTLRRRKGPGTAGDLVAISEPNIIIVDSESSNVTRIGTWSRVEESEAVGGSYLQSNAANSKLTFSFKGSTLWIRFRFGPDCGKVKVEVDSLSVTIDLYYALELYKYVNVAVGLKENERHDVTVTVLGEKNTSSTDYYVKVDSFAYRLTEEALSLHSIEYIDLINVINTINRINQIQLINNITDLEKINPSTPFTRVEGISFYDPTASGNTWPIAIHKNYLYAGLYATEPAVIKKVDLRSFREVDTLRLVDTDEKQPVAFSIDSTNEQLYVGLYYPAGGKITKVDLREFKRVEALDLAEGSYALTCMDISDSDYLYAGLTLGGSPGIINRVDLTTFSKDASLTLASSEQDVNRIKVYGGYVYASLRTGQLIKAQPDLSAYDSLDLGEGSLGGIDGSGNYLYVAGEGKIIRVDLATFTKDATLDVGISGAARDLEIVDNYLYACYDTSPGKIVKIDLSTFTLEDTLTLEDWEAGCRELATYESYLYVSLFNIPGGVTKIDLTGRNVIMNRIGEIESIGSIGSIEGKLKVVASKRLYKESKAVAAGGSENIDFPVPEGATGCIVTLVINYGGTSSAGVTIGVYHGPTYGVYDTETDDEETISFSSESYKVKSFIFATPSNYVRFKLTNLDASLDADIDLYAVFI